MMGREGTLALSGMEIHLLTLVVLMHSLMRIMQGILRMQMTLPVRMGELKYGLEKYVNYSHLSKGNYCFATMLNKGVEPKSYLEASQHKHWVDATNAEMDALYINNTWEIIDLRDFDETFSPVVKIVTVRCLINLAVQYVYVDDIIITGNSLTEIEKYCLELINEFGLLAGKPSNLPMQPNISLTSEPSDTDSLLDNVTKYQKLIGKLIYLTTTRPDIAYTVSCLSQFMHNPLKSHLKTALKVIRYLKGSPGKGINVIKGSASSIDLKAYSDADWARCADTRRSITGYCVFMCGSLVSWKSKIQNTISKSSTEAEYRALASVTSKAIWILKILKDLKCFNLLPVKVFCDSNSAIKIAANPIFHERTKHLEIDLHFVREKIIAGVIKTVKIETANQIANVLTKGLDTKQHNMLCYKLGMTDLFQNKIKRGC
ncbi:ribonuclease H-like domain-containing protein [Tanacetum coccineum]